MERTLATQRQAFAAAPTPSRQQRLDRLNRLHNAILDHWEACVEAINADFGCRARAETEHGELYPVLENIAYYRRNLRRFMAPQNREVPLNLMPADVKVLYQPLGVVGIMVPWNFPFLLALSPLVGALAAGNRAMIKLPEHTPKASAAITAMIQDAFAEDEVTTIEGEADVAAAFSALPFDHLLFTGSTSVAHHVMRAAAENLTPLTLELGGKSPALIHESFPIDVAAKRLAFGKYFSGGQACIAPDYILCPAAKVSAFTETFAAEVSNNFATDTGEYTSQSTHRQQARVQATLDDAIAKGATAQTIPVASSAMPLTILTNVTDDMRVIQEEIFGPLLPIVPYTTLDEALAYINARPRALSLSYFDWDRGRAAHIAAHTHAGGMTVNDTLSQITAHDAPFGGIGPSGMGAYHGPEGFRTFSHAKTYVRKGRLDLRQILFAPPRTGWMYRAFHALERWKHRRR